MMLGTVIKIDNKWYVESVDNQKYELINCNNNHQEGQVINYIIEKIYGMYPSEKTEIFAKIIF